MPVPACIGIAQVDENELAQHREHAERVDLLVGIRELCPGVGVGQLEVVRQGPGEFHVAEVMLGEYHSVAG
jgi:hypothetical protein